MSESAQNFTPLIPEITDEKTYDDYHKVVDAILDGSMVPDQKDHPLYSLLNAVTERIVQWDKVHPTEGLDDKPDIV